MLTCVRGKFYETRPVCTVCVLPGSNLVIEFKVLNRAPMLRGDELPPDDGRRRSLFHGVVLQHGRRF